MDRKTGLRTMVGLALALCLGAVLPAAAAELAEVSVGESTVLFTPNASGHYVLRVAGPGDFYLTQRFRGDPPTFSVLTIGGGVVPDGAYVYEGVEILEPFSPELLFRGTDPRAMSDLITEFALHPERIEALRPRCREYAVQNYSWKQAAIRLESVYQELLGEKEKD